MRTCLKARNGPNHRGGKKGSSSVSFLLWQSILNKPLLMEKQVPPNKKKTWVLLQRKGECTTLNITILQANTRQMLLLYLAFDKPKCSSQVLSLTALQVIVGNRWFLSVKHRDIRKVNEIIQLRAERTFIMRFAAQIRDSRSILNARRTADKPERCRQEQDLISRRIRGVCAWAQMVCIYEDAASCCWGCSFHHTTPTLGSVAPTWRTIPANLARLFKAI